MNAILMSGGRRFFVQKFLGLALLCASGHAFSGTADNIVMLINSKYGEVCTADLTGVFSKTLKIDWTSRTAKIHAMKVLAEIGSVKEKLYSDGVRYFQFPNDSGTYNVIDWKTGEKKTISDKSQYYFR